MSAPALLQPRPKAPPTSSFPSTASSPPSRAASRPPPSKQAPALHLRDASIAVGPAPASPHAAAAAGSPVSAVARHDALSDRATAGLIRRVLCSSHPSLQNLAAGQDPPGVHQLLPPLTSSNALDLQLYAILAIVVRDNIQSWYNKITPDHAFVDEVVAVIAHCTRAVEDRARHVDWERVLLHDVAEIVTAHIEARKIALAASVTHDPNGLAARSIYATLRPHPALLPVPPARNSGASSSANETSVADKSQQDDNEDAYRQLLAQGILAVLLPSEDIQNPCLYALVSGLLSDLILGGVVSQRVCAPAFLYDMIRIGAEYGQGRLQTAKWAVDKSLASPATPASARSSHGQLARFGLVPSAARANAQSSPTLESMWKKAKAIPTQLLFKAWSQAWSLWAMANAIMALWASGLLLPARHTKGEHVPRSPDAPKPATEAILQLPVWTTIVALLGLAQRMPWITGSIGLGCHVAMTSGAGTANSRLDRLLAHHLFAPFAAPGTNLVPAVLRALRGSLFPNNAAPATAPTAAPGSAQAAPSTTKNNHAPKDAGSARRSAAFAILNLLPPAVAQVYLRTKSGDQDVDAMASDLEDNVLSVLDDEYMNKSLVFAVLERLLAALLPELSAGEGAKLVSDVLVDRGVLAAGAVHV